MLQVMSFSCLLLICIHVAMVTGQGDTTITLGYSTETSTDFYKDEPLVLSCQTENKPTGSAYLYGIKFDDAPGTTGCIIFPSRVSTIIQNPKDVSVVDEINIDVCEMVGSDPRWSMQLTILITQELPRYTISCHVADQLATDTDSPTVSQETLKLNAADIKEAPSGLVAMNLPERVVEDEQFTVACAAEVQGVPQSLYKYDILRSGMTIAENQNRYTPTKDDRVGFSVKCTDTAHSNWRNKSNTIATSQTLYPEFIDVGDDAGTDRTNTLNPGFITNTLTCDIIAHNGANIIYTWVSSVDSETRADSRVLTLNTRDSVQDKDTEIITCEGTAGELKQSITWTITWNMGATTTPITIAPSPQKSKAGLYGGVGAAAVVAVGICIAMALVVRHKRIKGTNRGADAATTLHFRSHDSASHEYDLPPVLGEVSTDNSSNVASTSTKTYEQLQMPVTDGVYSQPDEHLYSGLMKRTQQIQPTNQRDTTEASSDYVNCANLTPQ